MPSPEPSGDLDTTTLGSEARRLASPRSWAVEATLDSFPPAGAAPVARPAASGRVTAAVDPERYGDREEFAAGGMGEVWRVLDRRLWRRTLLKQLPEAQHRNLIARQRFLRELRIAARLRHPGIVTVYDGGVWPSGEPFYTMREVEGRDLDHLLADAQGPSERLALLPVVLAAAYAVAWAHANGVIHRDIKPANVVVGQHGEVVVIDWGLSRVEAEGEEEEGDGRWAQDDPVCERLTYAGSALGTPAFMAPEQAAGDSGRVGRRADVYALGGLLFELLSGRAPLTGPVDLAALAAGASRPPSLAEVAPDSPFELASIVDKALAYDPARRYADGGELARDLNAFVEGRLVQAHAYAPGQLIRRWARRRRPLWVTASLVLAVLLVLVGVAFERVLTANVEKTGLSVALADQRDELQGRLAEIRRVNQATLVVHGAPASATVSVDGRPVGRLEGFGQPLRIAMDPGTVMVEVAADGHRTQRRAVSLSPQQTTVADAFVLRPLDGPPPDGMIHVPAGPFTMGCDDTGTDDCPASAQPAHTVVLEGFFIDRTEVTVEAWGVCVAAAGCDPPTLTHEDQGWANWGAPGRDDHPINGTTWAEAVRYCAWAGKRLPTEAQWEKAARGTDARTYPWGEAPPTCLRAVMDEDGVFNNGNDGCGPPAGTRPVGSRPDGASPLGALDMAGNVLEWTADAYIPYPGPSGAPDAPTDPQAATERVRRSSSWGFGPATMEAFRRTPVQPTIGDVSTGLRCAAPLEADEAERQDRLLR